MIRPFINYTNGNWTTPTETNIPKTTTIEVEMSISDSSNHQEEGLNLQDRFLLNDKKYCHTINGPGLGKPCVFPFYTGVKWYNSCTRDGFVHEYWCSTKVDDRGVHMPGNWGGCSEECLGVE